jgi:hypothetical protein
MRVLKILMSIPLDKRNFNKLGIKTYLDFFDKIQIFHIDEGYYFEKNKVFINKKIEIIKIHHLYQLIKFFKKSKGSLFLDYTLPGLKTVIVKTILNLKKDKIVSFRLGILPKLKTPKRIYSIFSVSKNFKTFHSKILTLIENKFLTKRRIYLCGGKKSEDACKKFSLIKAHSWDFDNKLKVKKNTIKEKNFFLYLDQWAHGHPDYDYFKSVKVDPKIFYDSLNNFFDKLENKFKKKVIIAAHPRANKYSYFRNKKSYFKNRQIYFNKTLELSQKCFATIAHDSTAISYSVIYKKPIIFILNDEMLRVKKNRMQEISIFPKELGSNLINIDKDNYLQNAQKFFRINKKRYDSYFVNYIHSGKKDKKTIGKIICDLYSSVIYN